MVFNKLNQFNTVQTEVIEARGLRLPDSPPVTIYAQNCNFGLGEVSKTLQDSSSELYKISASKLENVIVTKDGSLTRRPATIVIGCSEAKYPTKREHEAMEKQREEYYKNKKEDLAKYLASVKKTKDSFITDNVAKEEPTKKLLSAIVPMYVGKSGDYLFHIFFVVDISPIRIQIDCFNPAGKKVKTWTFSDIPWTEHDMAYLYHTQVLGTLYIGSPYNDRILRIIMAGEDTPYAFKETLKIVYYDMVKRIIKPKTGKETTEEEKFEYVEALGEYNRLPTAGLLFFQKRLWLAGDRKNLTTVFGSEVGKYTNFTNEDSSGMAVDDLEKLYDQLDRYKQIIEKYDFSKDQLKEVEIQLKTAKDTATTDYLNSEKKNLQRIEIELPFSSRKKIQDSMVEIQARIDQFKDTAPVSYKFLADKLSEIQWLYEYQNSIIIGTANRCYVMTGRQNMPQLSNTNVIIRTFIEQGVDKVAPVGLDKDTFLIVSHDRTKIIEISGQITKPEMHELTQLVSYFNTDKIKRVVVQRDPHTIIWVLTDTNKLYSMSYNKDSNVMGWSHHVLGGDIHIHNIQTANWEGLNTLLLSCSKRSISGKFMMYLDDINNCHKKEPFYYADGIINEKTDGFTTGGIGIIEQYILNVDSCLLRRYLGTHESRTPEEESPLLLDREESFDILEFLEDNRLGRFHLGFNYTSSIGLHPIALPNGESLVGRHINIDCILVYTYNNSNAGWVGVDLIHQDKKEATYRDYRTRLEDTIIYRPRKKNISMSNIQINIPHGFHFTLVRIEYKFTLVQNVRD